MTVIVTGAARGIGRSAVEHVLASGRSVVAVDLDLSPFESGVPNVTLIEGDVTDVRIIEHACAEAGQISGVVASAGISRPGVSDDYRSSDWDSTVAINLTAVFDLMRCAARNAALGASFVAISSVLGSQGFSGRAAYSASKAGIDGLVRSLAIEYAPRIRVNSIVPGFIMTDIARRNIAAGFIDDELIMSRTPLGRWGEPNDVAEAIGFLLGERSSWITGVTLPVDGGWLAQGLGAFATGAAASPG